MINTDDKLHHQYTLTKHYNYITVCYKPLINYTLLKWGTADCFTFLTRKLSPNNKKGHPQYMVIFS